MKIATCLRNVKNRFQNSKKYVHKHYYKYSVKGVMCMLVDSIGANTSYNNVATARAERFVNASDKSINRLVKKGFNQAYGEENKKFDKHVNATLKTLPLVAVASGLAMKKGVKGSLMSGLSWGLALAAPVLVAGANKAIVNNSPKMAKEEVKHPVAAAMANIAATIGAYVGLTALADKAIASPKVMNTGKKVLNPVLDAGKKVVEKVASKVSTPESVKTGMSKIGTVAGKVANAIPASVKTFAKTVIESPAAKTIANASKTAGKHLVKNAPTVLVFATLGAIIGKAAADTKKVNNMKAELKQAQFDTAKTLVNTYSAENKALRKENEELLARAEEPEVPSEDKTPDEE